LAILQNSTSWRVTAPLRIVSDVFRNFKKRLTTRTVPTVQSKDGLSSQAQDSLLHKTVRPLRSPIESSKGPVVVSAGPSPRNDSKIWVRRPIVAVIAWDVGHNPVGRAYLLAEALSSKY